jgi:hypothetical protein
VGDNETRDRRTGVTVRRQRINNFKGGIAAGRQYLIDCLSKLVERLKCVDDHQPSFAPVSFFSKSEGPICHFFV